MTPTSARQQVRQETRDTLGKYSTYDAAPSAATLAPPVDGGKDFQRSLSDLADEHGVKVLGVDDAGAVQIRGTAQDIRALTIDLERDSGSEPEVTVTSTDKDGIYADTDLSTQDDDTMVNADIKSGDTDSLRKNIDSRIVAAGTSGQMLDVQDLADELNDERLDAEHTDVPEITVEQVQRELTHARNAGLLLRNNDGSYSAGEQRWPVQGEPITGAEALAELRRGTDPHRDLTTGHRLTVGLWTDGAQELAEPKYREMVVDGVDGGSIYIVDDDPNGTFESERIPLVQGETENGEHPRITREENGAITVETSETEGGFGDVIPGQRFTLSPAPLTNDYTRPRPLINDKGEESPFDLGPTLYNEDPDYGDRVTLSRTVHFPDGTEVGRIYQGDQRQWVVDQGNGSMEDPAFDSASEAAEHLHYASGGRGGWSKPSAENVPLFEMHS